MCALSQLHVITARDADAPKGHKLEFEISGKLKSSSIVAAQRGTKVVVEKLFHNLPVRKKELEKNIKREYGKVLSLLQAYACISTGVRVVVSNQMPKASKSIAFSTAINNNTKDNITNVFGIKTLHALVKLDLKLEMQPSKPGSSTQASRILSTQPDSSSKDVMVQGHISRPVFGEGRQAPDRQFFFVNSRPCGLPQVAKAFNEVYKSFNVSQSPFIFANLVMDTHAYDVNVSPDKRTILLHDQSELLESLKAALLELFEAQEQSVPQTKLSSATQAKLPSYKPLSIVRQPEPESEASPDEPETPRQPEAYRHNLQADIETPEHDGTQISKPFDTQASTEDAESYPSQRGPPERLIHNWMGRSTIDREEIPVPRRKQPAPSPVTVPNAFDRMRPPRTPAQIAEITIGDTTTTTVIGTGSPAYKRRRIHTPKTPSGAVKGLRAFAMPGSQMEEDEEESEEDDEDDQAAEEHNGEEQQEARSSSAQAAVEEASDEDISEDEGIQQDVVMDDAPARTSDKKFPGEAESTQAIPVKLKEYPPRPPFIEESSDEEEDVAEPVATQDDQHAVTDHPKEPSSEPDGDYLDENAKRMREDENIARLIHEAEQAAAHPSADNLKRASQAMKSTIGSKYSVLNLAISFEVSLDRIRQQAATVSALSTPMIREKDGTEDGENDMVADNIDKTDAEAQLSLTVSKADFARMTIAGQFNLGFIIALRPDKESGNDDLFIIDQHAADEKFNFERFTRSLTLDPQRLAQPKQLFLTAVEEEIILSHPEALTANGFIIETDSTGTSPVGERCKLLCLPTSKETTFDLSDLEELLHLLSDHPVGGSAQHIPRPSKVRKMLAMRACRSSIMVGKTLTQTRMRKVVGNLGEMDKPWNCPHGRPTMRHLAGLGGWRGWDGVPVYEKEGGGFGGGKTDWRGWLEKRKEAVGQEGEGGVEGEGKVGEEDENEAGVEAEEEEADEEKEEEENAEDEEKAEDEERAESEGGAESEDDTMDD